MGKSPATPLPKDLNMSGKTIVVTGASAGLGLETVRRLLQLKCSTMVLAVRNVAKGEACVKELREDPMIKKNNPTIKVLEVDVERYDSIQAFTKKLQQAVDVIDILILNAGVFRWSLERSPTGHEKTLQVNYISNVLILAELLPFLQASATKKGSPTRVTWVGSRQHDKAADFETKGPFKYDDSVFARFDDEKLFSRQAYGNSKLICAMFLYKLAARLDPKQIELNTFCPGFINTGLSDYVPIYMKWFAAVYKFFLARSVQEGGIMYVNAAAVAGPESHGKYIYDKAIQE